MSNRDDWENVAAEIEGLGRERLVTELHNAFVAGQESIDDASLLAALAEVREFAADRADLGWEEHGDEFRRIVAICDRVLPASHRQR